MLHLAAGTERRVGIAHERIVVGKALPTRLYRRPEAVLWPASGDLLANGHYVDDYGDIIGLCKGRA
jgi:hypothetical protein